MLCYAILRDGMVCYGMGLLRYAIYVLYNAMVYIVKDKNSATVVSSP